MMLYVQHIHNINMDIQKSITIDSDRVEEVEVIRLHNTIKLSITIMKEMNFEDESISRIN